MTILSKVQTAIKRLAFTCFVGECDRCPSTTKLRVEGGFTQLVQIFSEREPKIIWRGTALLDPGNEGPNLITEEAMRYVHGQPTGPGTRITTFDNQERTTGGEVKLCFAGPKNRIYKESFHHMPQLSGGYDMILNYDFYVSVYASKVPGVLMIRKAKGKDTKEQKQLREERKRQQEENARQQEADRRENRQAEEASRLAKANHSN